MEVRSPEILSEASEKFSLVITYMEQTLMIYIRIMFHIDFHLKCETLAFLPVDRNNKGNVSSRPVGEL